ncbi:MAG TPA: hypothetical protein VNG29_01820 [Candidatus Paceibacterota bacterium]|nr:hypothetical protein [Candidatus Paceibacterota bacterium]
MPPKSLHWTFHARDKMRFYRLSEQRVRQVFHAPKRVEEGVAPKTIAMMAPTSTKGNAGKEETWSQEIWVMVEDKKNVRKIISAWRYPGRTKPRSAAAMEQMRKAYNEYKTSEEK